MTKLSEGVGSLSQECAKSFLFHNGTAQTLRYSDTSHPPLPGPVPILSSSLVLPGTQPHLRQETERKTMEGKGTIGSKMEEKTIFQRNPKKHSFPSLIHHKKVGSNPLRHASTLRTRHFLSFFMAGAFRWPPSFLAAGRGAGARKQNGRPAEGFHSMRRQCLPLAFHFPFL